MDEGAITITFGEQVENGNQMQRIGKKAPKGFSPEELDIISAKINSEGYTSANYRLKDLLPLNLDIKTEDASVLVVRNGSQLFTNPDDLYLEQKNLLWDTKKFMRGKVKNSLARYNLCYADFDQTPDYENGKGRVYNFKNLPYLKKVREGLEKYLGVKGKNLYAEGNYYYDISYKKEGKCGIGWHGDSERNIIVGVRLGPGFPAEWNWFYNNTPIGARFHVDLSHGDFYIMSQKATGSDWEKGWKRKETDKNILTLRHACGNRKKYLDKKSIPTEYVYLEFKD